MTRSHGQHLTETERAELHAAIRSGLTTAVIAREFNVSTRLIQAHRKSMGYDRERHREPAPSRMTESRHKVVITCMIAGCDNLRPGNEAYCDAHRVRLQPAPTASSIPWPSKARLMAGK